ncbi:MAG: hypothetical protein CL949_22640 [Erythrobacter sp.]|nr:hypothetical protein [Erythrobacter sp.]|tara:strand:+ start:154 stop:1203 length:1050 start_codon:yes stop_codon:yes gene_type:complete
MQRLNYCTQAIQSLRKHEKGSADFPQVLKVCELIALSEKFVLPENGELIHSWGQMPDSLPAGRLPYPFTAIETQWTRDSATMMDSLQSEHQSKLSEVSMHTSTRRISLSFEVNREILGEITDDHEKLKKAPSALKYARGERVQAPVGRITMSIYYLDPIKRWEIVPAGLFQSYDPNLIVQKSEDSAYQDDIIAMLKKHGVDTKGSRKGIPYVPVVILPTSYQRNYGIRGNTALQGVHHDVANEANWIQDLVTALSCQNVKTERCEPSAFLQKERKRAKKPPLFSFHYLTVSGSQVGANRADGTGQGHASPRTHLRRGHVRRLSDGRTTWVNEAIINPGNGFADKVYNVR